jgi:DNA-binding NarL/FixJ family response regulator
MLRAGLESLLGAEPSIVVLRAVVGADHELEDASPFERVASLDPDVILWATDAEGLEHGDDLSTFSVVVLTEHADSREALRALRAGARAVLPLDAPGDEILAVVQAASAGLVVLPRELAADVLAPDDSEGAVRTHHANTLAAPLTPREREVLALLAEGLANKAIAPRLGITEHTVKAHVAAIYDKLHAGNRAEAVVAAARQGLLLL